METHAQPSAAVDRELTRQLGEVLRQDPAAFVALVQAGDALHAAGVPYREALKMSLADADDTPESGNCQ